MASFAWGSSALCHPRVMTLVFTRVSPILLLISTLPPQSSGLQSLSSECELFLETLAAQSSQLKPRCPVYLPNHLPLASLFLLPSGQGLTRAFLMSHLQAALSQAGIDSSQFNGQFQDWCCHHRSSEGVGDSESGHADRNVGYANLISRSHRFNWSMCPKF